MVESLIQSLPAPTGSIVITTGLNPCRYTQIIAVRILNIEGFLFRGGGGGVEMDGWIERFLIRERSGEDLRTAAVDAC